MAKKKAAGGFVLAKAIREVLEDPANRKLTAPLIVAEVQKRHPQEKINAKSAEVAVSTAKKKLGLSKKTSVRKRVAKPQSAAASASVRVADLVAAGDFVKAVGSVELAKATLDQFAKLTRALS